MLTIFYSNKIKGFTLTEILITLGIIGIITALTLPAITENIRGKILQSQLKKAYSVMAQALLQFQKEEELLPIPKNYPGSYFGKDSFLDKYSKHFQGNAHCLRYECSSLNIIGYTEYAKMIKKYQNYPKNNTIGGTGSYANCLDDGIITATDSMLIVFDHGTCIPDRFLLTVDINGINKKPNALGHDLFVFEINPQNGALIPAGGIGSYYENSPNSCNVNNSYGSSGAGCTYKAMNDENYFKNLP